MEYEVLNGIGWRPDAEQRGYTPPPVPEPFAPPPVAARTANVGGTTLEQAHAAMVNAKNEFQKHINKTNEDRTHYTDEGYRGQIARFRDTDAAKAVDAAVTSMRARRDQAEARVNEIRRGLTQPGDAAQESRNSRYWDRTKAVLDATDRGRLRSAAEELLASADRAQLSVLAEELTPYLKSKGQVTEVVDKATGAKRDLLDLALDRVAPELGAARAQLTKANNAVLFVEKNARALQNGFDQGRPPSVLSDPFAGRFGNTAKYDPDQ